MNFDENIIADLKFIQNMTWDSQTIYVNVLCQLFSDLLSKIVLAEVI